MHPRASRFPGISRKETIPPDLLHFFFMTNSPPSILKLSCTIILPYVLFLWLLGLRALGNAIPLPRTSVSACLTSALPVPVAVLSQELIVILEVACVCLTEARVSQSSDTTLLALVCKGAMTDGDPSSRPVIPPSPPLP